MKKKYINKFRVLLLHYKKLGLVNFLSYFFQRTFRPQNGLIKISVLNYRHPVFLRNCPSDKQIFTQIFLREELKIKLDSHPEIIIDGGANIGFATVYLKNKYPDAKIFSVEPNYSNYSILKKNTELYNGVNCYHNGIWNKNARLKIVNENSGNESFRVIEIDSNEMGGEIINAITIGEIVHQNKIKKIGLLKLDIEGSEQKVFEANYNEWLSITDNMLVEIHNWINSVAEETVLAAVKDKFSFIMAGEYHYFSKSSS